MKRLPELDGLRGITILLVIVFHHSLFGVGWVGVQLFFGHLQFPDHRQPDSRQGSTARYVLHGVLLAPRICVLFPVYFAYLAMLAVLSATTSKAAEFKNYYPYLLTYTYNLAHLRRDFVFSFWFGHFWSLCIEEQFYLLWPLVVFTLAPRRLQSAVIGMILLAPLTRAVAAIVLRRILPDEFSVGDDAPSWFTPSQMDGFAFGAAVAVFRTPANGCGGRCPGWWELAR